MRPDLWWLWQLRQWGGIVAVLFLFALVVLSGCQSQPPGENLWLAVQ